MIPMRVDDKRNLKLEGPEAHSFNQWFLWNSYIDGSSGTVNTFNQRFLWNSLRLVRRVSWVSVIRDGACGSYRYLFRSLG